MTDKEKKDKEYWDKWIEQHEAPFKELITQKWGVGFNDRGMGHGDYGIVVDTPEITDEEFDKMTEEEITKSNVPPVLVIGPLDKIVAEHIVEVHNASLNITRNINET